MTELHDWQKAFKLKQDLIELDVEKLEKAIAELPRLALTNTSRASMLKAAIEAGWILEPHCEVGTFEDERRYFYDGQNIDEMKPGAVRWLGGQVDLAYSLATEVPKNL